MTLDAKLIRLYSHTMDTKLTKLKHSVKLPSSLKCVPFKAIIENG